MNIKDKVVVITGSSKGLGKALAIGFIKAGAKVIINSRNKEAILSVASEIGAARAIAADVSKESEIEALAQDVVKEFGQIDIWINNAGIWMPHAPIEQMDWIKVHDLIEINLFGTIYGSKTALIQMRKQGSGAIVNILSTSALQGRADSSGYCASKYAAAGFTNSLRAATADTSIKVLSIFPGGMQSNFFDEKQPQDLHKYMLTSEVADKIILNLEKVTPEEEMIIKRPSS